MARDEATRIKADALTARIKLTEDLTRATTNEARRALSEAFVRGQDAVVTTLEGMIYSSEPEELADRLIAEVARLRKHLDETT